MRIQQSFNMLTYNLINHPAIDLFHYNLRLNLYKKILIWNHLYSCRCCDCKLQCQSPKFNHFPILSIITSFLAEIQLFHLSNTYTRYFMQSENYSDLLIQCFHISQKIALLSPFSDVTRTKENARRFCLFCWSYGWFVI